MREPDPHVDHLANLVIGAAIEVHREMGPGREESVYEKALAYELILRQIRFERQALIDIHYKGQHVGLERLDLWIERRLVVELKAVEKVLDLHKAQVRSYLMTTGNELGLLLNFNVVLLKDGISRIVMTH